MQVELAEHKQEVVFFKENVVRESVWFHQRALHSRQRLLLQVNHEAAALKRTAPAASAENEDFVSITVVVEASHVFHRGQLLHLFYRGSHRDLLPFCCSIFILQIKSLESEFYVSLFRDL